MKEKELEAVVVAAGLFPPKVNRPSFLGSAEVEKEKVSLGLGASFLGSLAEPNVNGEEVDPG